MSSQIHLLANRTNLQSQLRYAGDGRQRQKIPATVACCEQGFAEAKDGKSRAGQSFSELPGDRHVISANASKTKSAKLLAVFVVDTNKAELTIAFGN